MSMKATEITDIEAHIKSLRERDLASMAPEQRQEFLSYEAWRITFQSSEQAAWAAYTQLKEQQANSMATAMEHIAFCCATYAGVHDLEERAKGAQSMGSMALGKAQALREGRLTPEFIHQSRGSLSSQGASRDPSAEGLQEALKLAVTCLSELYKALGVGDTNETFQHTVALRTVIDLKERHRKQNARIHELRNQMLAVSSAADSLANATCESEADAALDAIEAAIGQKPSNISENIIQSFLISYNTHPKKNEFLSINGYFDWWKANRRQARQNQEPTQ